MIIHDCSTTITCDHCSEEFTVTKKVGTVNMRRLAKGFGWVDTGEQDLCPRCAEKRNKEASNG